MKYLIIFLFFFDKIFAQHIEAMNFTYLNNIYNTAYVESKDELYVYLDNSKSIYVRGVVSFKENTPRQDKNITEIKGFVSKGAENIYVNDFIKEELVAKENIGGNEILYVSEQIPIFNWQLHDEFKVISGIKVQKATSSFRGRNYTAWCDLENPVSVGPWKFNNLPGLAYEIIDDGNDFYFEWFLIKQNSIKFFDILKFDISKQKTITLKEYVVKLDEYRKKSVNIASTRSDVESIGFDLIESKVLPIDYRIRNKEIKYEWEK